MADKDRSQGSSNGPALTSAGFEFAAAVAGLTLVGYWIDRHYDSAPWGLLIGAAVGLIGGTYNIIRAALRAGRDPRPSDGGGGSADGDDAGGDRR